MHTHNKNALKIRLNESAVFLRTASATARRQGRLPPPSMLRGLLVLHLVKPTKITSIELELVAKAHSSWPEGVGARRIEVSEEHTLFTASTVYFRAGEAPRRRHASLGPGVAYMDEDRYLEWENLGGTRPHSPALGYDEPEPREHNNEHSQVNSSNASSNSIDQTRRARRISVDNNIFHLNPISHQEDSHYVASPPYTPFTSQPGSPIREHIPLSPSPSIDYGRSADEVHHGTFDSFRTALRGEVRRNARSSSLGMPHATTNRSISRRPSMEDLPEDAPSPSTHRASTQESASSSTNERRGRRHSRFRLSLVSSALFDAVRPPSHHRHDTDSDHASQVSRGRTMEKADSVTHAREGKSKETNVMHKLGDLLKMDGDEHKHPKETWKEFKPGTHTFPISIAIPSNSPPSMQCPFGGVSWRLRAVVHRPGAFTSKLVAAHHVVVESYPMDEEMEEEDIIIERHWDQQLQYLIAISGRNSYIGGTIPITITLLPLAKVKIYKLSVTLEERIDYYTQMKRVSRTDPINRFELVNVKNSGKHSEPILPLTDNSAAAFENSPLYELFNEELDDLSEMASSLMGPGPWTFHKDLKLPPSCNLIRFTNKNKRANIVVTHSLKIVIRAERGDAEQIDSKTGKRKLFDIAIQIPIQVLSCRCSPEWIALPQYSDSFVDTAKHTTQCPCDLRRATTGPIQPYTHNTLERVSSSDSSISNAETEGLGGLPSLRPQHDTIMQRNTQFERLVAGRESELGEAPPAYNATGTS